MSTILKGKVKWYNGKKGYGFIERDDKEKDVFIHISELKAAGIKLQEGNKVQFELADDDRGRGPSAKNIRLLD